MFSLVKRLSAETPPNSETGAACGLLQPQLHKPDEYRAFSYPNYVDLRDANAVFSSLAAHNPAMVGVSEGDTTRRTMADTVSSNYFATFGFPSSAGVCSLPQRSRPGSGIEVGIVSYNFWKKTGSDPNLIGKTVRNQFAHIDCGWNHGRRFHRQHRIVRSRVLFATRSLSE